MNFYKASMITAKLDKSIIKMIDRQTRACSVGDINIGG